MEVLVVKVRIAAFQDGFAALIYEFAQAALELGQLPPGADAMQLTFEVSGMLLAANANFVLRDDPAVLDMARQVVRRRLGVAPAVTR